VSQSITNLPRNSLTRDGPHNSRPTGDTPHLVRFLKSEVVIESDEPDIYWHWMRARGGMDFVEDFVRPGTEDGVHLDLEPNYPRSVITDRIAPENVHRLIAQIRFCSGLV
jgi:hypothetical protein